MKNNTVVTIGDSNYLWGIFMLICSMRKNGMDEPVIAGVLNVTPEEEEILTGPGNVTVFPLRNISRSLTCCKPLVMLQARTEYITWADCDGFFTGNCSERLIPLREDEIHIRVRRSRENRSVYRRCAGNRMGSNIPKKILHAWQKDVCDLSFPRISRSCSACFLSVHRSFLPFLAQWQEQMETVLPPVNAGVVDRSLKYYHQLDESVLNSLLAFSSLAPRPSGEYRLDKVPEEMFIHFVGRPKPWEDWSCRSFRHFDSYTDVAEYALRKGYPLPGGKLPFPLDRKNRTRCSFRCPRVSASYKLHRGLKRLFG